MPTPPAGRRLGLAAGLTLAAVAALAVVGYLADQQQPPDDGDATTPLARQPTVTELHAVINRADGSVEDLGQIGGHYRNPIRQAWWRLVGQRRAEARIAAANQATAQQAVTQVVAPSAEQDANPA